MSFLHALTGGAKVTTTARNGQHIAIEADHAHRGLLERRPYLTLASDIRCDVAIANLHELPLKEMHARVCDLGGRSVSCAWPGVWCMVEPPVSVVVPTKDGYTLGVYAHIDLRCACVIRRVCKCFRRNVVSLHFDTFGHLHIDTDVEFHRNGGAAAQRLERGASPFDRTAGCTPREISRSSCETAPKSVAI